MIEGVSFNKHKSKQEHLMKDSVICYWRVAKANSSTIWSRPDWSKPVKRVHNHGITMAKAEIPNIGLTNLRTYTILAERKSWIVRSALYFRNF
jgi:hypothetical protein